jgi:hypothetical protein
LPEIAERVRRASEENQKNIRIFPGVSMKSIVFVMSALAVFASPAFAAGEGQLGCSFFSRYFEAPPHAFLVERGERLGSVTWESRESTPSVHCTIHAFGDGDYSTECTTNQYGAVDDVRSYFDSGRADIESCVAFLNSRGFQFIEQASSDNSDGGSSVSATWVSTNRDAVYTIKLEENFGGEFGNSNWLQLEYRENN